MFYRIMNDVHTRIVVCFYRGRVGADLSVLWVAYWFSIPRFLTSLAENSVIINKALFICIYLFKDAVSILDRITLNVCGIVNSEFERMGKEAIVTYVEYCFVIYLESWIKQVSRPRFKSGTLCSSNISPQPIFLCLSWRKLLLEKWIQSYTLILQGKVAITSSYIYVCVCVCVCVCF
jgi:hypothetical protein